MTARERVFAVVGYAGVELLDIACLTSSLDIANRIGADPPYRMSPRHLSRLFLTYVRETRGMPTTTRRTRS